MKIYILIFCYVAVSVAYVSEISFSNSFENHFNHVFFFKLKKSLNLNIFQDGKSQRPDWKNMDAHRTDIKELPKSFDLPRDTTDEKHPVSKVDPKFMGNFTNFTPPKSGFDEIHSRPNHHTNNQNFSTPLMENPTTPSTIPY